MSDIDYSKYSYKDYKRGGRADRKAKGKIRYNFINYEEYKNYNPDEGNDKLIIEPPKADKGEKEKEDEKPRNTYESYQIKDLRSKKKSKMNIGVKKIKNEMKRDIMAVMMVILCFMLTIVSVDIISGGELFATISENVMVSSGVPIYYAVEVGSYPDIDSARTASDLFRSRGAGGYVINDGTFRVIAAVYPDKSDAEAIVKKLIGDGLSGTIYEIRGAKVNYNKYGDLGEDIESAVEYCGSIYGKLYNISNSMDKGEKTENEARIQLSSLLSETKTQKDVFVSKTMSHSNNEIIMQVRAELSAYSAIIENLLNSNLQRPSLLADLRYSYTLIAHSYCSLLRTIK